MYNDLINQLRYNPPNRSERDVELCLEAANTIEELCRRIKVYESYEVDDRIREQLSDDINKETLAAKRYTDSLKLGKQRGRIDGTTFYPNENKVVQEKSSKFKVGDTVRFLVNLGPETTHYIVEELDNIVPNSLLNIKNLQTGEKLYLVDSDKLTLVNSRAEKLVEQAVWLAGSADSHKSQLASEILQDAAKHIADRAASRDLPEGERSMGRTVVAFNAVTGATLNERDGWLFMAILKAARATAGAHNPDDYQDGAAYFALAGECASKLPKV